MEQSKTAIIMAGGGARSTHGGGFLYALATELGITTPDIMIASSGDSGSMFYYCTGQYEAGRRIFLELLSTRKFISPWRFWRMLDVDYLVDTIFRKLEPLDVQKLLASPIHWHVPVTNYDSGAIEYLSAQNAVDPFEILRATSAAPIVYGKKVLINGKRYIDGELGPTLEDHIRKAVALGATRLLVVQHDLPPHALMKLLYEAYALTAPEPTHEVILHDLESHSAHITLPGVEMIVLSPQNLPIRAVQNNPQKLQAAFDRGVADARKLEKEIKSLFSREAAQHEPTPALV